MVEDRARGRQRPGRAVDPFVDAVRGEARAGAVEEAQHPLVPPGAVAQLPLPDERPPSPCPAAPRIGEIEGCEAADRLCVELLVGVEREDPVVGRQLDGAALLGPEPEKRLVLDPCPQIPGDRHGGVGRTGVDDEAFATGRRAPECGGEPVGGVARDDDTRDR